MEFSRLLSKKNIIIGVQVFLFTSAFSYYIIFNPLTISGYGYPIIILIIFSLLFFTAILTKIIAEDPIPVREKIIRLSGIISLTLIVLPPFGYFTLMRGFLLDVGAIIPLIITTTSIFFANRISRKIILRDIITAANISIIISIAIFYIVMIMNDISYSPMM